MGVKPDWWIRKMAAKEFMIDPFSERVAGPDIVSFGLQPAGYDARLDPVVKIIDWARGAGRELDPLSVDEKLFFEKEGEPNIILPPHACMIGKTIERFRIPRNCVVRGAAKTTYSSVGINFDVAGIHPGWEGHLKLHISNATPVPIIIRGGQGIVYLEFHEIDGEPEKDYDKIKVPRFQHC